MNYKLSFIILIVLIFNLALKSKAQQEFDIVYEINNDSCYFSKLKDDLFAINYRNNQAKSLLINSSGDKTNTPCDHIQTNFFKGKIRKNHSTDYLYCEIDSKAAIYSITSKKVISDKHENLEIYNDKYYVCENDGVRQLLKSNGKVVINNDRVKLEKWHDQYYEKFNDEHIGITFMTRGIEEYYSLTKVGKKYGLNRLDGSKILQPIFNKIQLWKEGFVYTERTIGKKDKLYSLYNDEGEELISSTCCYIRIHGPHIFELRTKSKQDIILNDRLDTLYTDEFDKIRSVINDMVTLERGDSLYLFTIENFNNDDAWENIKSVNQYKGNFYSIERFDGSNTLYNRDDDVLYSGKSSKVRYEYLFDSLMIVKKRDVRQTGVIDIKGNVVHSFGEYAILDNSNLGGYLIDKGKFKDLYNKNAKLLISNVNLAGPSMGVHNYILKKDNKVGLVSKKGVVILPFEYNRISQIDPNYVYAIKGNKCYLIKIIHNTVN